MPGPEGTAIFFKRTKPTDMKIILLRTKSAYRLLLMALVWGLSIATTFAQTYPIKGEVQDTEGEPLIGASVVVKNAAIGALTDELGRFSLNMPAQTGTLVITYFGYKPLEIAATANQEIRVVMEIAPTEIEEQVIVGYGTQRKSDLTGAISSVKAKDIARIPSPSVGTVLQGKLSGVQVIPSSGEPGAQAVIRIRGVGTLNDASPLFVVDGMLLNDISFLNTNDIASIEALKDASATAIYGSRGANGVIIITTKKGVSGKPAFSFNAYYGMQQVTRQIALTNGSEYAMLANESATNTGIKQPFPNPDTFGIGTNWQDQIFRNAPIQNYQLSASGGSDKMTYLISGDYINQSGIIKTSEYQRVSLRINNEYKMNKFITVGHNLSIVYNDGNNAPGVLGNAYRADPTVVPIDSSGKYGNTTNNAPIGNPVAQFDYNANNPRYNYRTVGNLYLDFKFLKNFNFHTSYGLDYSNGVQKTFVPVYFVSSIQQNQVSRLDVGFDRSRNWLWENTLSYNLEKGKSRLNLLGGITSQNYYGESIGGGRINYPSTDPTFYYLNAGQIEGQTNYNSASWWSMASYLFRANYTFDNRFLFTVSGRADGSSKFGKNNRYGYFPSVAAGWNVSNEKFMSGIKAISRLKIRGSWGIIGNEKIGGNQQYALVSPNLSAVFGANEVLQNGSSTIAPGNPNLQWESTSQSNAGFEIGLFNNRLQGEVDWYRRVTNDILTTVPIPGYVGSASDPTVNAASVLNTGVDFKVTWQDARPFNYHVSILGSTVRNEVLSLGQGKEEILAGGLGVGGLLGTRTVVGSPIGSYYGYKVAGIYQNQEDLANFPKRGNEVPGDLRFEDINGDGVITALDRTDLGSPTPNLIFGANFGLEIKGFDLEVDFNGQRGNYIANAKKMARFGTPNYEVSYLNRWTGEGTSNSEPRITDGGGNYDFSTRFLEKGDFLRLRNVSLGYTLPSNWTDVLNMGSLRIFVTGTNLVTWTQYSGYTPEILGGVLDGGIDFGIYPIARVYNIGVNANF